MRLLMANTVGVDAGRHHMVAHRHAARDLDVHQLVGLCRALPSVPA